jgi:hypothetical protein
VDQEIICSDPNFGSVTSRSPRTVPPGEIAPHSRLSTHLSLGLLQDRNRKETPEIAGSTRKSVRFRRADAWL